MDNFISYMLRAECKADFDAFALFMGNSLFNIDVKKVPGFPDVTVQFDSKIDIDTLKRHLSNIEDGHVMVETISVSHLYTGERKS